MFLCNIRGKWIVPANALPAGLVVHAASKDCERPFGDERPGLLLVDPNVYLWGLRYEDCSRVCQYLSTYPWVPIDVPAYADSQYTKRAEWLLEEVGPAVAAAWPPIPPEDDAELSRLITACIDWQVSRGVGAVVLPAPLVDNMGVRLDEYVRWLDLGLTCAEERGVDALMSLPLAERVLPGLLDDVLDVLTSRRNLRGLYVCVETTNGSRYITDQPVTRALLEISYHVGYRHRAKVIVNFADILGLACLGVGASGFATGYTLKDRQLALSDFEEAGGGGGAYPRLLSLAACSRFRTGRDMEALRDRRLLPRLGGDRTDASAPLFDALTAGQGAADVPGWEENYNNDAGARAHLNQLLVGVAAQVMALGDLESRAGRVFEWLQDAEMLSDYLQRRFDEDPLDEMGACTRSWRGTYEEFCRSVGLLR